MKVLCRIEFKSEITFYSLFFIWASLLGHQEAGGREMMYLSSRAFPWVRTPWSL